MAQKSWKIEEIFPRFVNAQMAKGVSDKTVLTYNRHFHSLGYHLDMTMTFDELTKEALDSMLVSLRKSGVSPNTISSYARVFRTFLKWCSLNSTNFDTYTIFPDDVKHFLRKSLGILKKMLDFLSEVYYNRNILD